MRTSSTLLLSNRFAQLGESFTTYLALDLDYVVFYRNVHPVDADVPVGLADAFPGSTFAFQVDPGLAGPHLACFDSTKVVDDDGAVSSSRSTSHRLLGKIVTRGGLEINAWLFFLSLIHI